MVTPEESKKGTTESEPISVEEFSKAKRRRRPGACVSIQKGRLLFLPTALEKTAPPSPPSSDDTKPADSNGN